MSRQGAAIMVEPGTTSDALTAICERVQWRATAIEIQPLSSVCAASSARCCPPHHCGSLPCGCERWQQPRLLGVDHAARSQTPIAAARRTTKSKWSSALASCSSALHATAGLCPCGVERWHHQRRVRCCTHGQPRRSPATPRGSSAQATACLWWALPAIGAPAQTQRVVVKPRLRGCGHGHRGSTT